MNNNKGNVLMVEECVKNILSAIKPSKNDDANRVAAINELKTAIKSISSSISRDASVNLYGSYVSNLDSKWSDLDISVDGLRLAGSVRHERQVEALRMVKTALERTGIARKMRFIPQARVPVLSYESKRYNVSCDVTINNRVAQIKSKILNKLVRLDSRFRDLVLLVKEWAKNHDINDAKSGTLNSYSICLLVIFHLQTCDPPILPPLAKIHKGNLSDIFTGHVNLPRNVWAICILEKCDENIVKFKSQTYRSRNKSSLSQLLISFFYRFSPIKALARDTIICPYRGQFRKIDPIPGRLIIEDPFERSENTARAVGHYELKIISEAFKKTKNELSLAPALSYNYKSLVSFLARPGLHSQLVAQKRNIGHLNRSEGQASNRVHGQVKYAYIGNLRIE